MTLAQLSYRPFSWLSHQLSARNTAGYGIHSPMLFYLSRYVLPDTCTYYAFAGVESRRAEMLASNKRVFVDDYGTGQSGERSVSDIARTSLKPRREAQLLFRLAVMFHAREIVELGTSLGITTALLASTDRRARVTTFEGSAALLEIARANWRKLQLDNIVAVQGNIDDTLPAFRPEKCVEMAFIDANHKGSAMLRYFDMIAELMSENGIVVIDDIYASREMHEAWETVCGRPRVKAAFDLYSMGILFFEPYLEKRLYKIRF